jgi:hypothetical protein
MFAPAVSCTSWWGMCRELPATCHRAVCLWCDGAMVLRATPSTTARASGAPARPRPPPAGCGQPRHHTHEGIGDRTEKTVRDDQGGYRPSVKVVVVERREAEQ